ncbi:MAG: TRAM domain-containing protein [Acidimicrobiales bacterium]
MLDRSALLKHEARVGRLEEVLVEGPSRRNAAMLSGRTRQGKLVHFAQTPEVRAGSLVSVRVKHGAPYHLLGEVERVERAPRHKTRIPLRVS